MPIVPFQSIADQPVEWLWHHRLAVGHLHLLDGDPNQGKSFILADLIARLSSGRPWPDGSPSPGPAACVLLNGEDRVAGTTRARLLAAGADPERVHVWDRRAGERRPLLPSAIKELDDILGRTGARLLAIDPIMPFLEPGINVGSDAGIRRALDPLDELAERHRCTVLMSRHLRKASSARSLYGGLGSIAFIGACRLAYLAGVDPNDPTRSILAQNKSNLGPLTSSLAYTIASTNGAACVHWLGESTWNAADLGRRRPTRADDIDRARALLLRLLHDAPRPASELHATASSEGISKQTLRRAAGLLNLNFQRFGNNRHGRQKTYWLLPGQSLPAPEPGSDAAIVHDWLHRLRSGQGSVIIS
jgi:hypothetical protein